MSITQIKLYDCKDLQKCATKLEVEKYFKTIKITGTEQKYEALLKATNSERVDYFNTDITIEQEYNVLLDLFLDEEFRFLKGIY